MLPRYYYIEVETDLNHAWTRMSPDLYSPEQCDEHVNMVRALYPHQVIRVMAGCVIEINDPANKNEHQ